MRRLGTHTVMIAVAFSLLSAQAGAQNKSGKQRTLNAEAAVYRLDLALHTWEKETKRGTRNYVLLLEEGEEGRLRVLRKVPLTMQGSRRNYVEIGMKCDAEFHEADGFVFLKIEMEYTDLSFPSSDSPTSSPTIHEWESEVDVRLVPGTPQVVSGFDDPDTGSRYELEVKVEKPE